MDPTIFRAALRASAKVALTATLSSCGGTIHTTPQGGPPDATADAWLADAPAAVDAFVVADSPGPGTCNPPPVSSLLPEPNHPGIRIGDDLFDCCATTLGSALVADSGLLDPADAAASDPRVLGCCAVAAYRLNADVGPDAGAFYGDMGTLMDAGVNVNSNFLDCCYALKDYQGPACTPWGPPMPPAMPDVA
jgi:hypothetical protein